MAWRVATGLLCLSAGLLPAAPAMAARIALVYGHTQEIRVTDTGAKAFVDFNSPTETYTTSGIQFNLHYEDVRQNSNVGFDGANGALARQRVQDTLDILAGTINESGTLDVLFSISQTDGSGALAFAGSYYPLEDGFFSSSCFDRLSSDVKPYEEFEEVAVTVDFGRNWNFTALETSGGTFDFLTVLLHEFCHALGFSTLGTSTGASAFANEDPPSSAFTECDALTVFQQGGSNLWAGSPPAYVGSASKLTSGTLFCEGANAFSLYNQGVQPGVYAPGSFTSGSSLSHWNTGSIAGGAVMEHAIASGVDKRRFAPVDVGALIDLGYTEAAVIEDPEDPSVLRVDFAHTGFETGSITHPFNTVAEAVAAVDEPGSIEIAAGTSDETLTITKAVSMDAVGGTVRIGDSGAKSEAFYSGAVEETARELEASEHRSTAVQASDPLWQAFLQTLTQQLQLGRRAAETAASVNLTRMPEARLEESMIVAQPDARLALRLSADAPIDPTTIVAEVRGAEGLAYSLAWEPEEDPNDLKVLWIFASPVSFWPERVILTLEASAATNSGGVVEGSQQFSIE